jgi:hypothetical protein
MFVDYLPQKGVLSARYLPPDEEIPEGWTAKFMTFNFQGISYWVTAQQTQAAFKDFLLTQANLWYDVNEVFTNPPIFSILIYHNHGKQQLQLMQEAELAGSLLGTNETQLFGSGSQPYYLKSPYLIAAGDTVTVEISYGPAPPFGTAPSIVQAAPQLLSIYFTMIGGEPRE